MLVEHCKRHVAYVTFSTLRHFHIDAKRIGKLSRQQRVTLLKAVDEDLECRDYGSILGGDDLAFGREFHQLRR